MRSEPVALAGFAARRYAVIDVGTNSVKFHIGERAADGGWRAIVDRADVTRLGQDLESTGRLGDDAIHRTAQAIGGMAEEAARNDVESIVAVGTAGLRLAPNRAELIDAVRHIHGVDVEVIPGDEEARLAYLATASELDVGDDELTERLMNRRWERTLSCFQRGDDLRRRYLPQGGSSCPRGLGWRLSRSQQERTRREDRRSNFYEIPDNLIELAWLVYERLVAGAVEPDELLRRNRVVGSNCRGRLR